MDGRKLYHSDDDTALKAERPVVVSRLFHVFRRNRLELLLEVISSRKVHGITPEEAG